MTTPPGAWPPPQGPPEQGPPWPGRYGPPQQGQAPHGAPAAPPPVDVVTAYQLLCAVAVLGVVNMIASLLAVHADRATYVDQLLLDVAAQDAGMQIGRDTAETLMVVGLGLTALIGLGVTALYLLFVHKMRAGRNWARMLVTMIGVMMVFVAVPTLFGLGAGGGAVMVAGGASILQAVLSVGAIVLMHRGDSNRYFMPGLPPR